MQDTSRLETALRNAHNAGDTRAAQRLAREIQRVRGASQGGQTDFVPSDGVDGFGTPPAPRRPLPNEPTPQERSFVTSHVQEGTRNPIHYAMDTLAGGLTEGFNVSDELKGLGARASNLVNGTELRPDMVAQAERERLDQRRTERPVTQLGRELVGGSPAALVSAPQAGIRGAIGLGGVLGAAAGFGEGDTFEERARNALTGATIGSVTGGVFDGGSRLLGKATGALQRGVRNLVSGRNMTRDQRRAVNRLRAVLARDGVGPQDVERTMREYAERGFDDAMWLDVGGDNTRRLFRQAANQAGEASEAAEGILEGRLETRAERVGQQLGRYMGGDTNYRQTLQQATQERARRAAPLFEESLGTLDAPVMAPREQFADLLERMPRNVVRRVERAARLSGGSVGDLSGQQVSLLDMQALKFGLDDAIETAGRGNAPLSGRERGLLIDLRNELVDRMPEGYRRANEVFAGDSAMISALQAGRSALREDTEEIAETVARMSSSERDMFRLGLVRAIRERAGNVRDNSDPVAAIIGNPNQRERLRQAFDSEETFDAFLDAMRTESQRVNRARFIASSHGSQTAPRQADEGGFIMDLIKGNAFNQAARAVGSGVNMVRGIDEQAVNRAVMELGSQPLNPDAVQRMLVQLETQYGRETANAVRQVIARTSAPAAITASSGSSRQ